MLEKNHHPTIEDAFALIFAPWAIAAPPRHDQDRKVRAIRQAGWDIEYLWGEDEAGIFLEYIAGHRMLSGDDHRRIRDDGAQESFPSLYGMVPCSDDPEENEKLRRLYRDDMKRIENLRKTHGFKCNSD